MLRWKAQHWLVNSPSAVVFHPVTVPGMTSRRTTSGGPPKRSSFIVVTERVVGRGPTASDKLDDVGSADQGEERR
jgi:hypothetical protein